ncbi:MAG TPA: hexose kinase [Actinomycetota bacterium]|nr:hexose kinase [Actinomycetota bacterium]
MIVCLSANPSVDKLFEVERVTLGAIHRPRGFVQVPGGKGLNVARAAAALGAEVRAVALLRGHAGKWIEEALAAEGVACRAVWTHGESRSSLSVADGEGGGLTEFYEHGSEVPASSWPELAHAVGELLGGASWLTISGSIPPGAPADGYAGLVVEARAAGVAVALDASGQPLLLALDAGPDVVKVNASEASELLGRGVADREAAIEAARELRERAGRDGHAGVVTRGAEGVAAVAPDGSEWEGRLYVGGRYPVGSGDAFLAGLVTGLERGGPWPDALRLALAAAAANAELAGAGRLDPSRAASLVGEAEVGGL